MADSISILDCVGKRVLAAKGHGSPTELTVVEKSPSGAYVRVRYANSPETTSWEDANSWRVLEVLPDMHDEFYEAVKPLMSFASDFIAVAKKHGIVPPNKS